MLRVYKKGSAEMSEKGMVSFLVTLIMMSVVVLVVVGFTQSTNDNRRQALDNALGDQAFYAAESGVNAAIQQMNGQSIFGLRDKNQCADDANWKKAVLPTEEGVENTCLLIEAKLKDLVYNNLSPQNNAIAIPIIAEAGNVTQIKLTWDKGDTNPSTSSLASCQGTNTVSQASWKCSYAALRVDVLPDGNYTRDAMLKNTLTAFLFPSNSGGSGALDGSGSNIHGGSVAQGTKQLVLCTEAQCSITISGFAPNQKVYLRISSLYRSVPTLTVSTNVASLVGTQIMIDSTGRSQDVYKRIRVRVPLVSRSDVRVDNAVQSSGSICKKYDVFSDYLSFGSCTN